MSGWYLNDVWGGMGVTMACPDGVCVGGGGVLDVSEGQFRTGQVRTAQVKTGQVKVSQVRSGLVRTGQLRTGEVGTGQVTGHVMSCDVGTLQVRTPEHLNHIYVQ